MEKVIRMVYLVLVMLAQFAQTPCNCIGIGLIWLYQDSVPTLPPHYICGNQIQLSVFSIKILAGKGNHRHFLSNTYYKHKYFAATIFTSLPTFGIKYPFFLLTSPGFTAGTKRINSCSTTGGRNATNIIHLLLMEVNFITAFLL